MNEKFNTDYIKQFRYQLPLFGLEAQYTETEMLSFWRFFRQFFTTSRASNNEHSHNGYILVSV